MEREELKAEIRSKSYPGLLNQDTAGVRLDSKEKWRTVYSIEVSGIGFGAGGQSLLSVLGNDFLSSLLGGPPIRLPWWLRVGGGVVCLQCRRPGFNPWVRNIPWRSKWQPTPVVLPGKSHGQRNLVGYTVHGVAESDTTERLHFHHHSAVPSVARTEREELLS